MPSLASSHGKQCPKIGSPAGKAANLMVLDQNLPEIPAEDISETHIQVFPR